MFGRNSVFAAICLLAIACSSSVVGQQPPEPSAEHGLLQELAGAWDVEVDFYPEGPSGPKMSSKASDTSKMLGGFFVITDFEGEIGGAPFSGHGTTGYDPLEKLYVGTWCDTMTPHLMTTKGKYDSRTKTLTMEYEGVDPSTGKKSKGKNVDKFIDENSRVFEMFGTLPGGKDMVKMMEARYKRRPTKK
jgi:Protein of unknown function (DUF1579)